MSANERPKNEPIEPSHSIESEIWNRIEEAKWRERVENQKRADSFIKWWPLWIFGFSLLLVLYSYHS